MQLKDSDSGEVRLFKLFMIACEQFHMSDAEANKVLLRELQTSPSLIVPEALQKQLSKVLETCSSTKDFVNARPVISQVFKFYRHTNMLKLIT